MALVYDDGVPEQTSNRLVYDDEIAPSETTKSPAKPNLLIEQAKDPLGVIRGVPRGVAALENAGDRVKSAFQASLDTAATETGGNPVLKAAALTAASELGANLPFKPSEFAMAAVGEALPMAIAPKKTGESIANRFLAENLDAAKTRFNQTRGHLGQELLERPQHIKGITGDKVAIYNSVNDAVSTLDEQIKTQLKLSGKANATLETIDPNAKRIIDNIAADLLRKRQDYSFDDKELNVLKKVLGSDQLDIQTANEFRKILGSEVGPKFNKVFDQTPELTQGIRTLYGKLRDAIGSLNPKVDQMLSEQHTLMDIKNAVLPEAARGYSSLPSSEIGFILKALGARNIRLAQALYNSAKARGVGTLATVGSNSAQKVTDDGQR